MSEWNARAPNAVCLPMGLMSTERIEYVLVGDDTVRSGLAGLLNWGPFEDDGGLGRIERWRRVETPGTVTIAVGDVNGTTKGSGARANGGKPAVELIPAGIIADYCRHLRKCVPHVDPASEVLCALGDLGQFQMRRESVDALRDIMARLDHDGNLINEIAEVFDYGRHKYSAWNWARGMAWSIPIGCAIRHLLAMRADPMALDPESGKSHRGHVGCNIVMLLWFLEYYPEGDDRPALPSA